ncbi:ubiquinol-cytochrome c chaperone [Rhodoblastus acidophilus]|jgi:cytochrome b pre-mRNA-processing protein 3|uniref:Ubiquinol-cytochrome c chaperone n=1 Tax=Rhodoblastus acidophilus TaxID=1074 RepID=A0A6N8DQ14_RHOAC|nr:ubiquinol-cytochrome C chaperone family protein [Rhodoblastus acidophilus]MCW2275987.1 cytochrome b pre-mRNA-processing protein 3 [Rhodoblastus acidophilus]MTV32660.1 ubiquinol-cytochrome c chaperone [Rhodoblastus acidophilus]
MIFGLFRKKPFRDEATALARAITAQSRLPAFFLPPYGAPDTFEGRFEVTVLNAGLLLRRLSLAEAPGPELAQATSDAVFSLFDDALREKGISDTGVPKRMKKLAGAFSGRGAAYIQAAGQEGDDALAEALARNVLAGQGEGTAFADYFRRAESALAAVPLETFLRGEAPFPAP